MRFSLYVSGDAATRTAPRPPERESQPGVFIGGPKIEAAPETPSPAPLLPTI
jgi:hypothetical protein